MSDFHALKVVQVEKLTPNAVAISFEIPRNLKKIFDFKPGQYITIRHSIDGEEIRRAYSISSSPAEGNITIGVKKVENGRFSVYANTSVKAGDTMEVMPPEGRFVYDPDSKVKNVLAFAAGSGITPIMSIAQAVLESHPENTIVLVYGNQNREETMFYQEITDLTNKYTDRFFVQFLYSRAHEENSHFGRIEASTVNFITRNRFKEREFNAYYICGPEPMIHTVSEALESRGIGRELIFTELFTSSEDSEFSMESSGSETEITVTLEDEVFNFEMKKDMLVLDAVLDQGIDAPYSCQGGVCSTCIARVTEGNVVMEKNQILTDSEVAEGLILSCQAHPTSDILKIDYDDV